MIASFIIGAICGALLVVVWSAFAINPPDESERDDFFDRNGEG